MSKVWTIRIASVTRPSAQLCNMMNSSAASAWPTRKAGVAKASPMKPPSGSTSSLIMVAISELRTRRYCGNGNRNTRSTSW